MDLHPLISLQIVLVLLLFPAIIAAQTQTKTGCPQKCGNGNVSIEFPFGIGDDCCLNSKFNITCDDSTHPPKPRLRNSTFEVSNIDIVNKQVTILRPPARTCNEEEIIGWSWFRLAEFAVSNSRNKFTVIGCDSYGYVKGFKSDGIPYSAGCMTTCNEIDYVDEKSCSGSGCCQIEIPDGLYNVNVSAYSFNKHEYVMEFNNCTYAFIVDADRFNFSRRYLENIPKGEKFPIVLDWWVAENDTSVAEACKGNSTKYDKDATRGHFRCTCLDGYEGNPYIGCTDIDECKVKASNNCSHYCENSIGGHKCSCRKWYKLSHDHAECVLQTFPIILITTCVGAAIMVTMVGSTWIYLVLKHKNILKQKEKFFRQNGGFTLQQKFSSQDSSCFKIFTAVELDKATNHYHEDMILGKGGFGVVFKGVLSDKREVAIKKATATENFQVDQFINEVLILSQINHRNVVKLFGCCLETQAPLLVYEFIPNGTLFEHIHGKPELSSFPWERRLKVAAETAVALSYLHFEASVPIVHRDVKTVNILLAPNYTAKVSDFGASRFVPTDETQVSTMVQGTLGYLDPEYLLTSQLTDKSDVYSFGVVLVELLTGLKPLSFERPEAQRSLAMHFLLSVKHNCLSDIIEPELLNRGKDEQVKEVALMAKKCLALKGEERPSMKEVAQELEGLLAMEKHPWEQFGSEETEHLLMHYNSPGQGDGGSLGSTIEIISIGGR